MKQILASGAVLALLFAEAQAAEMTAADIERQLVGAPIFWWELDGWRSGDLVLLPDGTAKLTIAAPEHSEDHGRWYIEANRLCTTWAHLRGNMAKCYSISPETGGEFVTSGGNGFRITFAGV